MKSRFWVIILSIFLLICNRAFALDVYSPYVPKNNEIIFNQSMYKIDVIDPKVSTNLKGINYPGLRLKTRCDPVSVIVPYPLSVTWLAVA